MSDGISRPIATTRLTSENAHVEAIEGDGEAMATSGAEMKKAQQEISVREAGPPLDELGPNPRSTPLADDRLAEPDGE